MWVGVHVVDVCMVVTHSADATARASLKEFPQIPLKVLMVWSEGREKESTSSLNSNRKAKKTHGVLRGRNFLRCQTKQFEFRVKLFRNPIRCR
jgi:hypothetical protein